MTEHTFNLFLLQGVALLSVGLASGALARKLHQPAVLGEFVGGVPLGPSLFGALAPHEYAFRFLAEPEVMAARGAVTDLGLLFLSPVCALVSPVPALRASLSLVV